MLDHSWIGDKEHTMRVDLQHKTVSEIVKILKIEDLVTVDLVKLGHELNVSVVPKDFGTTRIEDEKIICAFVSNKEGRSCIFYSTDLLEDKEFLVGRTTIIQAFAKYIITGNDNFFITQNTSFSNREKSLIYEMLMPESQVKEILGKLILPTTFTLAKIFNVSQEFVRQRLDEMGIDAYIAGYNY